MLGAVVGLFLIVTGNDLPRTRPTMIWGVSRLGTSDPSDPVDVWWWRRVVGYVRVGIGVALFANALLDVSGLWRLIVLGAGAEVILRVAAGVSSRRVRRAIVTGVALSFAALSGVANAQDIPADRIKALPTVLDAVVPKLMATGDVPGTAVAVVHQGRVLLLRGYGQSQLKPDVPVDPARTSFRIGSVSKTLTALAVLEPSSSFGDARSRLKGELRVAAPWWSRSPIWSSSCGS